MTTVQTLFAANAFTIAIAGTSTASTSVFLPCTGGTIRLVNEGPNHCYVSIGRGAQTAVLPSATLSASAFPIESGADTSFGIPNDPTLQISIICRAAATCVLLVSVSDGM